MKFIPVKFIMRLFPKILLGLILFASGWLFIHYLTTKQIKVERLEDFIIKQPVEPDEPQIYKSIHNNNDISEHQIVNKPNHDISTQPINTNAFQDIKAKKKTFDTFSCDKVHIFYYPWYGNPNYDKNYMHWNHAYLPHWNKREHDKSKTGRHMPPDDVASDYYPELGPYSSKDPGILSDHIAQIRSSGVGVIAISYYPVGQGDNEGKDWSAIYPIIFDAAHSAGLKVTFHIEPYKSRNPKTVVDDIKWIIQAFGHHPALYRASRITEPNGPKLPFLYIYDSYLNTPEDWGDVLSPDATYTIRGKPHDAILIGLFVETKHHDYITVGRFDGFYTYFATNQFTYGSTWDNWLKLSNFASETNTYFIPSIGPGYIDVNIRAWNSENTRNRQDGRYYINAWQKAIASKPSFISITSFNEWHEGTQIEKAIPKQTSQRKYLDYLPNKPNYYLKLSFKYSKTFPKCIK